MSVSVLSKRYAKALVLLGRERGLLEQFRVELERLVKAFAVEKRLALLLQSPSLESAKKSAILSDLVALLKLSGEMRNFLGLLQSKDRLRHLPNIKREFGCLADRVSGIQRVVVRSAVPLKEDQRDALKKILAAASGQQIVFEEESDPSLIGGLQVELDGRVLDGTVRTQLERMAETITEGE